MHLYNCTNTEILQLKPLIVDISVTVIKVNFCNYIKKNSKYIQQLINMLRNKANEHKKKEKMLYQDKKIKILQEIFKFWPFKNHNWSLFHEWYILFQFKV